MPPLSAQEHLPEDKEGAGTPRQGAATQDRYSPNSQHPPPHPGCIRKHIPQLHTNTYTTTGTHIQSSTHAYVHIYIGVTHVSIGIHPVTFPGEKVSKGIFTPDREYNGPKQDSVQGPGKLMTLSGSPAGAWMRVTSFQDSGQLRVSFQQSW